MTRFARLGSALALAVIGCATPMASRDIAIEPDSKKGLVVVSFTNGWMDDVQWHFHELGSQNSAQRWIDAKQKSPDALHGTDQLVYALLLPEGEYEFFMWVQDSTGPTFLRSAKPFSIRFRAYPGRVTYVGNLKLDAKFLDTRFSMTVRDLGHDDIPLFLRSYSRISAGQVQLAPMRFENDPPIVPVAYQPPAATSE